MTYEIYGLRQIDTLELRYVGQTRHGRQHRLKFLSWLARNGSGDKAMLEFMRGASFAVEAVLLDTAATELESRAKEKQAIRLFANAGHRLCNVQHAAPAMLETIEPWTPRPTSEQAA